MSSPHLPRLSVVVLTLNEEANLGRCLASLATLGAEVWVVDSGSTDRTAEIAKSLGAALVAHPFETQAQQFNWALDTLPLTADWVLRLDADEYLTPELAREIPAALDAASDDVSGFLMRRRVYFMGRWIRHGGYYPTWSLRLFRKGRGRCENRPMDEHIQLTQGSTQMLRGDYVDDNRKGLKDWIAKHNSYSSREAAAREAERVLPAGASRFFGTAPERRRWIKTNLYLNAPLLVRPFLYFGFRYFVRLGFLDGIEGAVFHVLQGFWHQFLIDAKTLELRRQERKSGAVA